MVKVSPSLIKPQKTRFHDLPCGASVILSNNGYVWVRPIIPEDCAGGFVQNLEVCFIKTQESWMYLPICSLKAVPHADRLAIARVRNCIAALAQCKMLIYDTSIMHAYDASMQLDYEVRLMFSEISLVSERKLFFCRWKTSCYQTKLLNWLQWSGNGLKWSVILKELLRTRFVICLFVQ